MTFHDEQPEPGELHRLALDLARGAVEVVRRRPAAAPGPVIDTPVIDTPVIDTPALDTLVIDTKSSDTDLVTEVDRETERWLVSEISRLRPEDGVLGEEGGQRPGAGTAGVRWVLDPIDGTMNFVLGLPQYAVSIAAEINDEVVAGVVANPATGETFHAYRGGGAFLRRDEQDVRLTGPRDVGLAQAVIATGFGYDSALRAAQIAVVAPLLPRIADVRRLGSAALDLCLVAAGRIDAYFEAGLNRWDYAAGSIIATEAGCVVSGLRGRPASRRLLPAPVPTWPGSCSPLSKSWARTPFSVERGTGKTARRTRFSNRPWPTLLSVRGLPTLERAGLPARRRPSPSSPPA